MSSPGKSRGGLTGIPSLNDISMGVNNPNSSRPGLGAGNEISIVDNKRDYLKEKKRRDIQSLEQELKKEKDRVQRYERECQTTNDTLREVQGRELENVEKNQKTTLDLLTTEKDDLGKSTQGAIEKERAKMDQMHAADLEAR